MKLTIVGVQVVDIRVPKRATRDSITTDTNARDGSDHTEDLVKHSFSDSGVKFSNIETSAGRGAGSSARVGSLLRGD